MYNLFHNLQLVEVCQYVVGRSRKEARVQRHKTGLGSGDWGGPVSAGVFGLDRIVDTRVKRILLLTRGSWQIDMFLRSSSWIGWSLISVCHKYQSLRMCSDNLFPRREGSSLSSFKKYDCAVNFPMGGDF